MDQKMLLQEMQHRMANSLPSVPGLFPLAARGFQLLRLPRPPSGRQNRSLRWQLRTEPNVGVVAVQLAPEFS